MSGWLAALLLTTYGRAARLEASNSFTSTTTARETWRRTSAGARHDEFEVAFRDVETVSVLNTYRLYVYESVVAREFSPESRD